MKKVIGIVIGLVLIGVGYYFLSPGIKEKMEDRKTEKEVAKVYKSTPKVSPWDKVKKAPVKTISIKDQSGKELTFEVSAEEKEAVFELIQSKKRPTEEELKMLEDFYNKAASMWEAQVAQLIFEDLGLGQSAMDKYADIKQHYQEHRLSFFDAHRANGKEDKAEFAKVLNNVAEKLKNEMGVDIMDPNADLRDEDAAKVQEAMFKALSEKEKDFKNEHLEEIKGVLGDDGFKKYQSMKNQFNNSLTEGRVDPLFNL